MAHANVANFGPVAAVCGCLGCLDVKLSSCQICLLTSLLSLLQDYRYVGAIGVGHKHSDWSSHFPEPTGDDKKEVNQTIEVVSNKLLPHSTGGSRVNTRVNLLCTLFSGQPATGTCYNLNYTSHSLPIKPRPYVALLRMASIPARS